MQCSPNTSKILVVFESTDWNEMKDTQGRFMDTIFREAGWTEYEYTVLDGAISKTIANTKPNIVVACGEKVLRILTGKESIDKWRGGIYPLGVKGDSGIYNCKISGIYPPERIEVQYPLRYITVHDCRRILAESTDPEAKEPPYEFILRPDFQQTTETLDDLIQRADRAPLILAGDLETRLKHIACFGIAWTPLNAICIPFMQLGDDPHYWSFEEELYILSQIGKIFEHPNISWVFQNGLYDYQYFVRRWENWPRKLHMDTMLAMHLAFAGDLPKGLDFISSFFNSHYRYWKDEGKEWNPKIHDEDDYWKYNCRDAVNTLEASRGLSSLINIIGGTPENSAALRERWGSEYISPFEFQHRQFWLVLRMMLRGVRTLPETREALAKELDKIYEEKSQWFTEVLGHPLNIRSPKQMKETFYDELGVQPRYTKFSRKVKRRITTDASAMQDIWNKNPLMRPLVDRVNELRSIGVFNSTFIKMPLDEDSRIRCSYNVAGTETFRWSSSKNAFQTGGNLQNIPQGDEAHGLPNVKKLFLPDPGYIMGDFDLSAADAQVVAWEADDEPLKQIFKNKLRLHMENAKDIFGAYPPDDKHPNYKKAKAGVHATNYYAKPPTLARALGITRHEAEQFQKRWFDIHPAIPEWHRRVEGDLQRDRTVYNIFGYRRFYLGRIEGLLPEALAWIPQSTVALVIDHGLVNVEDRVPEAEILLQVHDSGIIQWLEENWQETARKIRDCFEIVLPYDDPLVIPVDGQFSTVSWGDCKKIEGVLV